MPSYVRETVVDAPLDDVWGFHSQIRGLEALTPDWMGLRVERVIGADGEPDPDRLDAGSEIALSMRPFDVGPRQHWTSVITEREHGDDTAFFRDEMVHGPFDRWVHTHAFFADGPETVVRDHVEYELPLAHRLGKLAVATVPFSQAGFEAMFRQRHRTTKAQLE